MRILYEHDKTHLYIRKPKPQFRSTTQTGKFGKAESFVHQRRLKVKTLKKSYKPSSIFRGKYDAASVASLSSLASTDDIDGADPGAKGEL